MTGAVPLAAAIDAPCHMLEGPAGRVAVYRSQRADATAPPMLLIHSVNAAASAFEMRPLFAHFAQDRAVTALDLPGFGRSERSRRPYTPELMVAAIETAAADLRATTGVGRIDLVALSLACEFAALAAAARPDGIRTLGLISPTGFDRRSTADGRTRVPHVPGLVGLLVDRPWSAGLFRLLTSRASIKFFLRKTWGGNNIDPAMVDYDWASARQPGAEHAPLAFLAGRLFSTDILARYLALRLPCWLAHGRRGDFVDYRWTALVADRPNWRVRVYDTGALPHFERTDEVAADLAAFLADPPASAP
jgi:pimeloyl-ACP methyl ester carboxylesterase